MVPMFAKPKFVLIATLFFAFGFSAVAESSAQVAPQTVVRNLYAAQKRPATDPFFQTKSRARLDKFFAKELADLIWNDAVSSARAKAVGQLGGDPLYNAQDMKITAFRIKRPMVGEGNLESRRCYRCRSRTSAKSRRFCFVWNETNARAWKITEISIPTRRLRIIAQQDFVDDSVIPNG